MKHYVYCLVDKNGELQRGEGSSVRSMFFKTDIQCKKWAKWHSEDHPNDEWRCVKFELVEVEE